jgi:hypothetical protein
MAKSRSKGTNGNAKHWCFAWLPKPKGITRAAALKESKWKPGSIITIGFLDGNKTVKERVKAVANAWTGPGMANLRFVWVPDKAAQGALIRISFEHEGSWSVLGKWCASIPHDEPTMNYGWLTPSSTTAELRRVVLHEFGHALGFIHEHQNPKGGIKWNKPQVYADLSGPPNNWSKATIDHNMFRTYAKPQLNATKLDPTSIMMYPIPTRWTLDGFSAQLNSVLSARDRALVKAIYR